MSETPALTPEEKLTPEQKEWRDKERIALENSLRHEFQKQLDDSRVDLEEKLREQNKKALSEFMEDYKKQNTPPTPEEVQKMLDQEYPEFRAKIRLNGSSETVVLRELPASAERKFVRLIQEKTAPQIREFAKLMLDILRERETDKGDLDALFKNLPLDPISDMISEGTAIVLSHALDRVVKPEEVEASMSHSRQLSILLAQADCNRVRDFFSYAFRLIKK